MKRYCLLIWGCCLFPACLVAQEKATDRAPDAAKKKAELFNPLLSTAIVAPGQAEVIFFNLLQSRNLTRTRINFEGDTLVGHSKESALTHILQLNYGVRTRINVGVDFFYTHLRSDSSRSSSYWKVIGNNRHGRSHHSLHYIGPRIRIAPFAGLPELTLQSSVRFPAVGSRQVRSDLGVDRVVWQNQVLFYQHLGRGLTGQLLVDYTVYLRNDLRRQTMHNFQYVSHFFYRIFKERAFIIASASYAETRESSFATKRLNRTGYEVALGGGGYWRITEAFNAVATVDVPIQYQIASLIAKVDRYTWWRVNLGVNYRFGKNAPEKPEP